jgi:two-component system nitrogen regulation response regulator NtrX
MQSDKSKTKPHKILVVDDESYVRSSLRDLLLHENYSVDEANDGHEALMLIKTIHYDVMLSDIKMPRIDGTELLDRAQLIAPNMPVVMISGHADLETAVDCVRRGAFDFIAKPLDMNRLLITIRNAIEKYRLEREAIELKRKVQQSGAKEMVGTSVPMQKIRDMVNKVAPTPATVLITGPNGTGKELVAQSLHSKSLRSNKPFVAINCAAIPTNLIESELFGHMKGCFTDAIKDKQGKFELASGGTIFLDEIGDLSLAAQAKLLRALQERKITRLCGEADINVDVRVLAATNKDLLMEIAANRFREDLYHRLAVINIHVPPLNDRRDDIPSLIQYFVIQICNDHRCPEKTFKPEAIELLKEYNWTGNIRELRNVVERLIILSGNEITLGDVQAYVRPNTASVDPLNDLFGRFESFEEMQGYLRAEWQRRK